MMGNRDLRKKDRQRLHEAFYGAFDRSMLEQVLQSGRLPGRSQAPVIGEGTHFRVLRIDMGGTGLSLAVKEAKPEFGRLDSPKIQHWLAAYEEIRRLQGPNGEIDLVPPMETIAAGERWGLVMPFGDQPLSAAAAHWQPVTAAVAGFSQALRAQNLEIDDVIQGRAWQGVPFVVDFSDLRQRR